MILSRDVHAKFDRLRQAELDPGIEQSCERHGRMCCIDTFPEHSFSPYSLKRVCWSNVIG